MTSPIQNVQPRSDDGGCFWLILLAIITGIGYGIYELYLTHPILIITFGIVLFSSAAILLWIKLDVPAWAILVRSIGLLLLGLIMFFLQIELLIIGGTIVGLLILLSFCQMIYDFFETPIYIIAIMVSVTIGVASALYFYINLLTAIICYILLLIILFFLGDWIEDFL